MWGARFHPGLLPSILRVPASELTDRYVPIDQVAPLAVGPEQLRDSAFLHALCTKHGFDPTPLHVAELLQAGTPVDHVARSVNWSTRHLRRLSMDWFGYGPKHLQRVLRLRRAQVLLDQGLSVTEAAARLDYADASHLWRDRRDLGTAPT